MACTTILVGKNASYDGSTMIARNDDSGSGHFTAKKFTVFQSQDYPAVYKSVISGVEIPLPGSGLRITAVPNAVEGKGLWAASGVNAANVGMTATETITSNPRVLGADPLVKGGIGEEDIVYLVLPYVRSAREGVRREKRNQRSKRGHARGRRAMLQKHGFDFLGVGHGAASLVKNWGDPPLIPEKTRRARSGSQSSKTV